MSADTLPELVASLESLRRDDEASWLRDTLALSHDLPASGGFAAAEDLLALIVRIIRTQFAAGRPPQILELGSGISTLVFAQTLVQLGYGQLTSLDHDKRFAERTQCWLAEQQLSAACDLIHAPLAPCPAESGASRWYDREQLPADRHFNLLLIDGPPAWFSSNARSPALPLLADRIAPGALILLDDYKRRGERHCVSRWQEQFTQLEMASVATRKGTAILRWGGAC